MRRKKDDAAYLWDILDAARTAESILSNKSYVEFEREVLLKRAVERILEIIGEAANHISQEYKDAHPEIPWKRMIGQRYFLAHEYGDIQYERLWLVVKKDIPDLLIPLKKCLSEFPGVMDSE